MYMMVSTMYSLTKNIFKMRITRTGVRLQRNGPRVRVSARRAPKFVGAAVFVPAWPEVGRLAAAAADGRPAWQRQRLVQLPRGDKHGIQTQRATTRWCADGSQ